MTLLKNITQLLKSHQGLVCLIVLVAIVVVVSLYSKELGLSRAGLKNQDYQENSNQNQDSTAS